MIFAVEVLAGADTDRTEGAERLIRGVRIQ